MYDAVFVMAQNSSWPHV